jgi:hypothetical protein
MAARKGINWDEQPLGKVSDNELARLLGVSRNNVSVARRRRGIEPLYERSFSPNGINWDEQPLGKRTDQEIANSLGVSKQAVHQARQRRGIPRYTIGTAL